MKILAIYIEILTIANINVVDTIVLLDLDLIVSLRKTDCYQ